MTIHVVKAGETLYSIAQQYGASISLLASDNGLSQPYALVEGQTLVILYPSLVHTVAEGENLYDIARSYGKTVIELYRNNYILGGNPELYPGQTLVIEYALNEPKTNLITNGYAYPNINESVLRAALVYMTYVAPFTYGMTENGGLISPDDNYIISIAGQYGVSPLMHLSTLTEAGNFSNELASIILNDRNLWEVLGNNILNTMREKGYEGLDIDFEFVYPDESGLYAEFVAFMTSKLNPYGYKVIVALAPKTSSDQTGALYEGHDYAALGAAANFAFVMTYEWGYTYGPPLAVAPINAVENVIRYAVSEIPSNKIIMGIPNYGYDWTLPFVKGESRARLIGNVEAVDIARNNGVNILFDSQAMSPYFQYTDIDGQIHEVWFEDARSINAKADLIKKYSLAGAGYWNLMRPFPQNWQVINQRFNIVDF